VWLAREMAEDADDGLRVDDAATQISRRDTRGLDDGHLDAALGFQPQQLREHVDQHRQAAGQRRDLPFDRGLERQPARLWASARG
jgi:hypothetical protein